MPPIYIMLAPTLLVSMLLWGVLIYLFTRHEKRYFWLMIPGLPLSALANLLIKRQAIIAVGSAAHVQPGLGLAAPAWFLAFQVVLTPLVEETVKVVPLLLPQAHKMLTSQTSALWVGFAQGVSFGLGEAIFIAYAVQQSGNYAGLPWYAFTGFLNERISTCFAHGVMTAVLVTGLQRGGSHVIYGYLAALGLHLFLNGPTVFYQFKAISYEWYSVGLVIPFIAMAVVFERMRRAVRASGDEQMSRDRLYWQRPNERLGE